MLSDDLIDLTVDPKDLLPQVVVDEWLPGENESVLFIFQQFNRYPPHPSLYVLPSNSNLQSLLHQDAIQTFDYGSLLKIAPPALSSISKAYQDAIKKSGDPILSITLQPYNGDPIRLLTWVFQYWVEIGHVVDIRRLWKVALSWVQECSA